MTDYIKFWLAKELIPFIIFVVILAAIVSVVFAFWIVGKGQQLWKKFRSEAPHVEQR